MNIWSFTLKIINKEIEKYITPLTLAIWIMNDGGWVKYGIRLTRNAFRYNEVKLLTLILYTKFELSTTIQKLNYLDKYSIYIKSNSVTLF